MFAQTVPLIVRTYCREYAQEDFFQDYEVSEVAQLILYGFARGLRISEGGGGGAS